MGHVSDEGVSTGQGEGVFVVLAVTLTDTLLSTVILCNFNIPRRARGLGRGATRVMCRTVSRRRKGRLCGRGRVT